MSSVLDGQAHRKTSQQRVVEVAFTPWQHRTAEPRQTPASADPATQVRSDPAALAGGSP
jgi:hypothetical protein